MIACDLGSNTFRVVQIDCLTHERVKEFERIVKTAEGIEKDGNISAEAINRVIDAVLEAKEIFDFENEEYKAVATAALRLAKNGTEVLLEVYSKTGLQLEIIDAEKEANYTRIGVENRLEKSDLPSQNYVLLDLGGGSSEVVIKQGDQIESKSFDIGIVTLVEKYGLDQIDKGIKTECEAIKSYALSLQVRPLFFIGASGTPTTIASFLQGIDYAHYDYTKVNGYTLTMKDMNNALEELLSLDHEARIRWVGVGRDDLIITGVKILMYILAIFGFEELIVIDDGLREGVAILHCSYELVLV